MLEENKKNNQFTQKESNPDPQPDSYIPAGLNCKAMRLKMENKDLLTQPGSIYVGTGTARESLSGSPVTIFEDSNSVLKVRYANNSSLYTKYTNGEEKLSDALREGNVTMITEALNPGIEGAALRSKGLAGLE